MLLRNAEQGKIDGLIYLASHVEGEDKIGLCGQYIDDIGAASYAAAAGFNCLLGHQACILSESHKLPRNLRKEMKDEVPPTCSGIPYGMFS